jgi:hypothetical protein
MLILTGSIPFARVDVFALVYTAKKTSNRGTSDGKGLPPCHLGHAFISAFRINYKLEETEEIF